ncbi:hypothetical protein [Streptomyces sp. NPDC003023]|uniref:hypothetical protein n=1 Tax=Streptomyces sp. NPDC003023 TaxID=3364675 RepID=UPI00367A1AAD
MPAQRTDSTAAPAVQTEHIRVHRSYTADGDRTFLLKTEAEQWGVVRANDFPTDPVSLSTEPGQIAQLISMAVEEILESGHFVSVGHSAVDWESMALTVVPGLESDGHPGPQNEPCLYGHPGSADVFEVQLRLPCGVVQHWTFDDVHVLYIGDDDDSQDDYPRLENEDLHGPGWEWFLEPPE